MSEQRQTLIVLLMVLGVMFFGFVINGARASSTNSIVEQCGEVGYANVGDSVVICRPATEYEADLINGD